MDSKKWNIKPYVIPASHIRGYLRGVQDEATAHLRLSVNQYTPKRSSPPPENAATIILIHGVGSSKESYEPFLAGLLDAGLEIRSAWAADIAWHGGVEPFTYFIKGKSYLLNEAVIGDEPHWDDAVRDTLQMVNHFQDEMPPPIVGIGQSWGGYTIMQTALFHPRLFTAVVALEPQLAVGQKDTWVGATTLAMARRRDRWSSREAARQALLKTDYYAAFDPEVFQRVVLHDLRDVPVKAKSSRPESSQEQPVTLTTPKAMEVATMLHPISEPSDGSISDYDPTTNQTSIPGFYRAEPALIQNRLGSIRPHTLYVFATESPVYGDGSFLNFLTNTTGVARGGNGGVAKKAVASAIVKDSTHPMPLEKPKQTAEAIVPWLQQRLLQWKNEYNQEGGKVWTKTINPVWLEKMSKL